MSASAEILHQLNSLAELHLSQLQKSIRRPRIRPGQRRPQRWPFPAAWANKSKRLRNNLTVSQQLELWRFCPGLIRVISAIVMTQVEQGN